MTKPHQTLPGKTLGVAGPNILSFIVGVCKYFIQWHILRVAGLNEGPVYNQKNIKPILENL